MRIAECELNVSGSLEPSSFLGPRSVDVHSHREAHHQSRIVSMVETTYFSGDMEMFQSALLNRAAWLEICGSSCNRYSVVIVIANAESEVTR